MRGLWFQHPTWDKMASEGVRLTNAYCPVSVCSPSRYALMTGRYPWRSWRKTGAMRNYERSMIESSTLTLAEMMQQSGYATAGFGKWHLGSTFQTLDGNDPAGYKKFRADDNGANLDLSKPVLDGPTDHGFDHWLGFSCASEIWIFEDRHIFVAIGHDLYTIEATPNKDHIQVIPLADYLPFISKKTSQYLEQQTEKDKPFFLYFAPYVPHIPLAVSEEYKGSTEAGLYGDYVHELDFYIGEILNKLEELELDNNTIVMFGSDNGSQFRITRPEFDSIKISNSPADIFDSEGAIGHRPNGSLRGTKWSIYEGGVRMPFMVRWPGKIKGETVQSGLFGMNDVMATLADVLGYEIEGHAKDSQNQWPVILGKQNQVRSVIAMQSSGQDYALRSGQWKYVWKMNSDTRELYNLNDDPSENQDLSSSNPWLCQEMHQQLLSLLDGHISLD
jgi:arylsulfatase A